jgi:hypothetical protein
MPRTSVNLNLKASNIELLELKFDQVKNWLDIDFGPRDETQSKIQTAIDEAYQEIQEDGSDLEYVVIKIAR